MPICSQKSGFGVKALTTKLTGVDGFFGVKLKWLFVTF
jgi:hypothetical protein